VVVTAAAASPVVGDVIILANTGALTTKIGAWTYATAGVVDSISPNSGQVGTKVTITGTNLLLSGGALASVAFGNVPTTIVGTPSNTEAVVEVGSGGTPETKVDVVLTADTGAITTVTDGWTVASPAEIKTVTPNRGQFGTLINITGVNLLANGTKISNVSLAGIAATVIDGTNPDFVVVTAGTSGVAGIGDITVVADNGAITKLANGFEYFAEGNITEVLPGTGQFGTQVIIQGTNLLGGGTRLTSVKLKGFEVQSVLLASNTQVIVVAAAGTPGPGSICMTSNTGAIVEAPCNL